MWGVVRVGRYIRHDSVASSLAFADGLSWVGGERWRRLVHRFECDLDRDGLRVASVRDRDLQSVGLGGGVVVHGCRGAVNNHYQNKKNNCDERKRKKKMAIYIHKNWVKVHQKLRKNAFSWITTTECVHFRVL